MPKKEELEQIVRGKGLEALRPSPENLSTEKQIVKEPNSVNHIESSTANSSDETSITFPAESTIKQAAKERRLNSQCVISEITPSPEQQSYIQEMIGENLHQIIIWDTYISQGEKRNTVFKINNPLTFHIHCTASGLLEQLKPEMEIYWITYDIGRMQLQPSYGFSIRTKPFWPNFRLSYEMKSTFAGFFKFHVIIDIKATDLFWVNEGFEFKIS